MSSRPALVGVVALLAGLVACGGPAKPATAAADAPDPPSAGPATGTPEGGGPLDATLIPPGKGWSCLALQTGLGELWCMRTSAECKEMREAALRVAVKDGASKEEAETSAGPPCAQVTPWCWTGPTPGNDTKKLHCFPEKEFCESNLKMNHAPDTPPPSGCAEVY